MKCNSRTLVRGLERRHPIAVHRRKEKKKKKKMMTNFYQSGESSSALRLTCVNVNHVTYNYQLPDNYSQSQYSFSEPVVDVPCHQNQQFHGQFTFPVYHLIIIISFNLIDLLLLLITLLLYYLFIFKTALKLL